MKGKRVDVIERQRTDEYFFAIVQLLRHYRLALEHVGHQVAVRQHGALGDARGAAGILQHSGVFGFRACFGEGSFLAGSHGFDE